MQWCKRILAVMEKEILHIFRDKIQFLVAFVAPFALLALCGFLYINGKVTQIPVAVYDQDQSALSRTIIRSFEDSERFRMAASVDSYTAMEKLLQKEQVYMALVIPDHLERDIKQGSSREVGIVLNASNLLVMNTVATAANAVVQTISSGITMSVMEGYGVSKERAYNAVTAINFRTRNWYNPTLSYLVFMLLGLIGTVVQQITLLGVAISFTKERELGSWRQLRLTKLRWSEMLAGKLLVYFLIYTLDALAMYGLAFGYFGIPMRGSYWLFSVGIACFVFVLTLLGMMISIAAASVAQAIEMAMLLAVPSFLISGYTWPLQSMPLPIQALSAILPLSHFLAITKPIAYMGAGWDVVAPRFLILSLFVLVCLPLTVVVLRRKLAR